MSHADNCFAVKILANPQDADNRDQVCVGVYGSADEARVHLTQTLLFLGIAPHDPELARDLPSTSEVPVDNHVDASDASDASDVSDDSSDDASDVSDATDLTDATDASDISVGTAATPEADPQAATIGPDAIDELMDDDDDNENGEAEADDESNNEEAQARLNGGYWRVVKFSAMDRAFWDVCCGYYLYHCVQRSDPSQYAVSKWWYGSNKEEYRVLKCALVIRRQTADRIDVNAIRDVFRFYENPQAVEAIDKRPSHMVVVSQTVGPDGETASVRVPCFNTFDWTRVNGNLLNQEAVLSAAEQKAQEAIKATMRTELESRLAERAKRVSTAE